MEAGGVGKHDAPEIGPGPDSGAEQTRELTPVPDEPEPAHTGLSVRTMIILGVAAAIVVSTVVVAVSIATTSVGGGAAAADPPPNLAGGSPVVIVTTSSPSAPAGSGSPSASPTRNRTSSPSAAARTTAAVLPAGSPSPSKTVASHSATPTKPPTATLTAQFQQSSSWPNGYQGKYTITNRGTATINGWTVVVTFSGPGTISVWDASATSGANHVVTFKAQSYNASIAPGGSVSFGFNVTGSPAPHPVSCTVNGKSCAG
jgi:hypothetical protein